MMRIGIYAIAAVVFGTALFGFLSFMKSGFTSIDSFAFAGPLFFLIVVGSVPLWPGIGLGTLVLMLPVSVFQKLEPGMVVAGALGLATILKTMVTRGNRQAVPLSRASFLIAASAIIMLARFIFDRPGSARLHDFGGLGESSAFLLGGFSYFIFARIMREEWDARRNLWIVVVLALVGELVGLVSAVWTSGILAGIMNFFTRPAWFLGPITLAWAFERYRRAATLNARILIYCVAILILVLAALTPHRSRPLFAVAIILSVSFAYGYLKKMARLPVLLVGLLVSVFVFLGMENFPLLISRSLSTVVPVPEERVRSYAEMFRSSDEIGWRSPFRKELMTLAWRDIKRHPLSGKGFVFSKDEVMWAMSRSEAIQDAAKGLAVSGCYHNSIVELAVFCGVPCALFFLLGYLLELCAFMPAIRKIVDPHLRILAAGILGFFLATSGQVLMNGGAHDFFYICVLMGSMRGIGLRIRQQEGEVNETSGESGCRGPEPMGCEQVKSCSGQDS